MSVSPEEKGIGKGGLHSRRVAESQGSSYQLPSSSLGFLRALLNLHTLKQFGFLWDTFLRTLQYRKNVLVSLLRRQEKPVDVTQTTATGEEWRSVSGPMRATTPHTSPVPCGSLFSPKNKTKDPPNSLSNVIFS